jgi:hypothetical protein
LEAVSRAWRHRHGAVSYAWRRRLGAWGGEPHVEMPVRGDAWRHQLVAARGGAGVGRQAARGGAGMERRTDGALDSRALFIFLTRAQFP